MSDPITRTFGVDKTNTATAVLTGSAAAALLTDMVCENAEITKSTQTAIVQDEVGEYIPSSIASYGRRNDASLSLKSKKTAAISSITGEICKSGGTWELTSLSVSTTKGAHSTVSISAHQHLNASGNVVAHTAKARASTLPGFSGFGASLFGLDVGLAAASLQSSTYTIEYQHTDEDDNEGNFLVGVTHGEKHTVTFEAIEDTAWTIPSGWTEESSGNPHANTQHRRRTLTISKYFAHSAPSGT